MSSKNNISQFSRLNFWERYLYNFPNYNNSTNAEEDKEKSFNRFKNIFQEEQKNKSTICSNVQCLELESLSLVYNSEINANNKSMIEFFRAYTVSPKEIVFIYTEINKIYLNKYINESIDIDICDVISNHNNKNMILISDAILDEYFGNLSRKRGVNNNSIISIVSKSKILDADSNREGILYLSEFKRTIFEEFFSS